MLPGPRCCCCCCCCCFSCWGYRRWPYLAPAHLRGRSRGLLEGLNDYRGYIGGGHRSSGLSAANVPLISALLCTAGTYGELSDLTNRCTPWPTACVLVKSGLGSSFAVCLPGDVFAHQVCEIWMSTRGVQIMLAFKICQKRSSYTLLEPLKSTFLVTRNTAIIFQLFEVNPAMLCTFMSEIYFKSGKQCENWQLFKAKSRVFSKIVWTIDHTINWNENAKIINDESPILSRNCVIRKQDLYWTNMCQLSGTE